MASSGPNAPGTLADDSSVGTKIWNNPSSAGASDNNHAGANCNTPTVTSHYLKATNFGFALGGSDTIDGIVVEIERRASNTALGKEIYDNTVKLVIGGSVVGTNKKLAAKWTNTDAFFTYGSSSDLWGNTITASDVNSSNFGVVLNVDMSDTSKIPSVTAMVDFIRMTIYYTVGSSTAISNVINVGYASFKNVGGVPIANIKKIINIV